MQAGDTVLPFLNTASGATEAIVLCGGTLSHLRRNPSVASGWSYKVIDAVPFAGLTSAAVVSSSTHNAMIMAAGPRSTDPKDPLGMCQLALEADGATWTCPSNGWFDWQLAGPIGGAATRDGDIYWYGWTQNANTATKNWDYAFYRWDGMGDNAGVQRRQPGHHAELPAVNLYLAGRGPPAPGRQDRRVPVQLRGGHAQQHRVPG